MRMEKSRGNEYKELLNIFRKFNDELYIPVDKDEILRANIAYFIDKYIKTDKWEIMKMEVLELCSENDLNGLIYYIETKIFEKYIEDCRKSKNEIISSDDWEKLNFKRKQLSKKIYEEKNLDSLDVINEELIPNWFKFYESIKIDLEELKSKSKGNK